jgi:hypothetical protein
MVGELSMVPNSEGLNWYSASNLLSKMVARVVAFQRASRQYRLAKLENGPRLSSYANNS